MAWKVQKSKDADCAVFEISGRLEQGHLAQLQEVLTSAGACREFALDLQGVKLVDQESVSFLADCEASGARLRNCPPYIREWITRERARS
jgi:ABC-type transporter Mla MlaB component